MTSVHLGVFGVSVLALLALAFATERHAEHLLGRLPAHRWRLLARIAGWLLLVASLAWSILAFDPGIGITLWLGWLSVAALALVFLLPLWPWQPLERTKAKARLITVDTRADVRLPRILRTIAAALLGVTVAVFCISLSRQLG